MTINQIILLLDIYRGDVSKENHPNTFANDIFFLFDSGYIIINSADEPEILYKGKKLVEAIKLISQL